MPLPPYDALAPEPLLYLPVLIANGQSLSGEIDLGSGVLQHILMPAGWTAADLTLQLSEGAGGTYRDAYDEFGSEITVKTTLSRAIRLQTADWLAVRYLKLRSGVSATPVAQGADRIITLVLLRR